MLRRPFLVALLLAATVQGKPLLLTTGADYPPYADPALPGGGMAVRIVRAALARQGMQAEIDWLPWKRGTP